MKFYIYYDDSGEIMDCIKRPVDFVPPVIPTHTLMEVDSMIDISCHKVVEGAIVPWVFGPAFSSLTAKAKAIIDKQAEELRSVMLSAGAGQAMSYQAKEAEARAWTDDATTLTPLLAAQNAVTGETMQQASQAVIEKADSWAALAGAIEGVRLKAKREIDDASSEDQLDQIIDSLVWPDISSA